MVVTESSCLVLGPTGNLQFTPSDFLSSKLNKALAKSFSASNGKGLLVLVSEALESDLPQELAYWRTFAREYITCLCRHPETESTEWQPISPPERKQLQTLLTHAPLGMGMEYLTEETLQHCWQDLDNATASECNEFGGSITDFLKSINPLWQMVGRVTFHLAENPRNETHPFAFLATYVHQLSQDAKLQYLPLGKALREYAGKKNHAAMQHLLRPIQAASSRSPLTRELVESKQVFQAIPWSPNEAYRFIQETPQLEASGLVVKVPDWWQGGRPSRAQVAVTVEPPDDEATSVGIHSMLEFSVEMVIGDLKLSPEEWQALLKGEGNLISVKGQWVEIDREKLDQVLSHWQKVQAAAAGGGVSFLQGMRLLAGFSGLPGSEEEDLDAETADWVRILPGDKLRQILKGMRSGTELHEVSLGKALKATLRPYQQAGLNWLFFMNQLGFGACLADDMGLGKTIQVISLLLTVKDASAPSLIIVPASLVGNWKSEIETFAPSIRYAIAHPSHLSADAMERLREDALETLADTDVVITTYGMLNRVDSLREASWHFVICDEAQAIKNANTRQTKNVKALQSNFRLALTGTPIENSLADLWSLFDFICPGLLGTASAFTNAANLMKDTDSGYAPLRKLVSPYILRRLKTDRTIISDLPDKTELRTECFLTKKQATFYQRSVKQLSKELVELQDDIQRKGLVLSYLMRFKQICNHPSLWSGDSDYDPKLSGKYNRLTEICTEISARQEKLLVFTQFREMTSPLSSFLETLFGRPGLVLHGGTAIQRRQKMVEQFQSPNGPPFFVISLKAGGTGLNLTAASHVVHFDRWWNPAVEDQATDRAYRIGQKRNVLVHKFVCVGTIEEKIHALITEKRTLADEILKGDSTEKKLTEMSDEELLDFVSIDLNSAVMKH